MDNSYLLELINEANTRGGGMVLNLGQEPAVVVLTIERYNKLVSESVNQQISALIKTEDNEKNMAGNKKVLVTGGAGYIGGHLVYELIKAGYEVVVLDNLASGKRENLRPEAVFIEGDLADAGLLADIFASNNFEAVFHMAASLEVEESVKEPEKYFRNNVINTYNLLKAMDAAGCKKIIFSSTAAVYGEAKDVPITEMSPLRPNNPYGSSKLLAERVIKYFCDYLGFGAVVFRYFNACGFNLEAKILPTHQSHLIYNVLRVAKGIRPSLEVYGNDYPTFDGTCIRDYVHVSDIVLPHILALEKFGAGSQFEIYNIGTGKGYSVAQVVNAASETLNKIIPMDVAPRRPGDAAVTVADNTKLLNGLGYNLTHSSLEDMVKTSWEGMKNL